jgi:hypothetical protein
VIKDQNAHLDLKAFIPLSFLAMKIHRKDENWIEACDHKPDFGVSFATYYFRLKEFGYDSDMSLDVTLYNQATVLKILDGVGVYILEGDFVAKDFEEKGLVKKDLEAIVTLPEAQQWNLDRFNLSWALEIEIGEEYVLEMPLVRRLSKVILQLTDPIKMEPRAAYRYGLTLKNYWKNMPNHAILRLLAKAQDKESFSAEIRTSSANGG